MRQILILGLKQGVKIMSLFSDGSCGALVTRLSGLGGCSENGCCCELGGREAKTLEKGLVTHFTVLNDGNLFHDLLGSGAQLFSCVYCLCFNFSLLYLHPQAFQSRKNLEVYCTRVAQVDHKGGWEKAFFAGKLDYHVMHIVDLNI